MNRFDVVVIGGGIAAVECVNQLKESSEITIKNVCFIRIRIAVRVNLVQYRFIDY